MNYRCLMTGSYHVYIPDSAIADRQNSVKEPRSEKSKRLTRQAYCIFLKANDYPAFKAAFSTADAGKLADFPFFYARTCLSRL